MKKSSDVSKEIEQPKIAKFILKDTISLRNEVDYTELVDMVHPLTYTHDVKKHPGLSCIPLFDKPKDEKLKERFLKAHE